jgi:cytochrome c-type biogenesis protein
MLDVSLSAAFLGGVLSFLSPCVLPLVPPYLSFLAGVTFEQLAQENHAQEPSVRHRAIVAALLFVAGFSTVFVLLGATASAFGQVFRAHLELWTWVAGLGIIAMGLHFLGVFRLAFLYREARFSVEKPLGLWGGYLMGLAFAFGWTPCIGPILAAILTLAGSQVHVGQGALLLGVYSAGLGLPFIAAAFAMKPFSRLLGRMRGYYGVVEKVMGGLLVLTGFAFLSGLMARASFWLLETFPSLSRFG